MRSRRFGIASVLVLAAAAACSVYGSEEAEAPSSPDDGGTDADAHARADASPDGGTTDGASDAPASDGGACPVGLGPAMRIVDLAPLAERRICIDLTEVTSAQYAAFRNTLTDTTPYFVSVPKGCSDIAAAALDPADAFGERPRLNVSFCSAAYYCAAQGKRLCGSLADGNAIVMTDGGADPPLEWEAACSRGRPTSVYPWGTTDPATAVTVDCFTQSSAPDATAPRSVGAAKTCGPADLGGPYDMIGNAWEWVNLRIDLPAVSYTSARGGSYEGPTVGLGCRSPHAVNGESPGEYARASPYVGFRCCADPK